MEPASLPSILPLYPADVLTMAYAWSSLLPNSSPRGGESSSDDSKTLERLVAHVTTNGDEGNGRIMNNIGYIYHHALFGTPKNLIRAAEWYCPSAHFLLAPCLCSYSYHHLYNRYRRAAAVMDDFGCFNAAQCFRDVCHTPYTVINRLNCF
jgi:hypothetical protein